MPYTPWGFFEKDVKKVWADYERYHRPKWYKQGEELNWEEECQDAYCLYMNSFHSNLSLLLLGEKDMRIFSDPNSKAIKKEIEVITMTRERVEARIKESDEIEADKIKKIRDASDLFKNFGTTAGRKSPVQKTLGKQCVEKEKN